MKAQLQTILLFLAVAAATLVVTLGGIYSWVAIQQRNRAGALAVEAIRQIQEGCSVSVQPAAPAPPAIPQQAPPKEEEQK